MERRDNVNPPPPDVASHTIDADVPCLGCRYDLRGLPGDGRCPECGRDVAPWVEAHRRRHPPPLPPEPDPPLPDEVPCLACGYDLRGQPSEGRCPECGADVGPSLVAHRTGGLTHEQARGLLRASTMLLTAIVAMIISGAIGRSLRMDMPVSFLIALGAWVLVGVAACRLPRLRGAETLRRAAIGVTLAACAMPALFISAVPLGLGSIWRWWSLRLLPLALSVAASILVLHYLARAAHVARLKDISRAFRVAALLAPVAGVVLTFIVQVNIPTYSLDFLTRQAGPVFGSSTSIGTIVAGFRSHYLFIWQFYVWLIQPITTFVTAMALYRLGKAMQHLLRNADGPGRS